MGSVIQNLKLQQIRIDGKTQSRVELNESTLAEYGEAITEGAKFPPVTVFHDGADYWLADGFHRFFAHKNIGALDIPAGVLQGTQRDAILYSVGANTAHGLRRSNDDKRKAVQTLLSDAEWSKWSDREIAKQCGVSHTFVASLRPVSGNGFQIGPVRKVERNGKSYEQNTANIGKRADAAPQPPKKQAPRAIESRPADIPAVDHSDELNEARFAITELSEENNALHDRLAVAAMDASDDEKQLAQGTITELRDRVKVLEAELDAVKSMRDQYMVESAEKSKQIAYWRKRAEKVAA